MGIRLALIRHGRTSSNVNRVMDARPPGAPLDEVGLAQAQALATRLHSEQIAGVYASAALRAQQTAQPLAALCQLPVQVLEGVHEIGLGDLEGQRGDGPHDVYDSYFQRWAHGESTLALPGGESAADVAARFDAAVRSVLREHPPGLIVIVSHGGATRIAARHLSSDVTAEMMLDGVLDNTGMILLESVGPNPPPGSWKCLEWSGLWGD